MWNELLLAGSVVGKLATKAGHDGFRVRYLEGLLIGLAGCTFANAAGVDRPEGLKRLELRGCHSAKASSAGCTRTTHSLGRSLDQHIVSRSHRLSLVMTL